jgi:hypothetical protein
MTQKLVYYTPHVLFNIPEIASTYAKEAAFCSMFNSSISLIDRTGALDIPPVDCLVLDRIPEYKMPDSFRAISEDRWQGIVDQIEQGKDIVIFYSGGIDSTLIVCLALMHVDWAKHAKHVHLAFNEDSVRENPKFFEEWIIPQFGDRLINASEFHTLIQDDRYVCVTGEFADNIFGSLTLKSYMDSTGDFNAIHKDFNQTGLPWLLAKIKDLDQVENCREMINVLLDQSPIELRSNHDGFWWLNFATKWQAVKFRLVSHAPTADLVDVMAKRVLHFFETAEFQQWALYTDEEKVQSDWYSYKLPAKKLILECNGDMEYFKYKTKYPSIPSLTRYSNMFDFIYLDESTGTFSASKNFLNLGL